MCSPCTISACKLPLMKTVTNYMDEHEFVKQYLHSGLFPNISGCLPRVLISKHIVSCACFPLVISTNDFLQVDMSQIGLHLLISRSRASKDMADSDIKMSGFGRHKVWPVENSLAQDMSKVNADGGKGQRVLDTQCYDKTINACL